MGRVAKQEEPFFPKTAEEALDALREHCAGREYTLDDASKALVAATFAELVKSILASRRCGEAQAVQTAGYAGALAAMIARRAVVAGCLCPANDAEALAYVAALSGWADVPPADGDDPLASSDEEMPDGASVPLPDQKAPEPTDIADRSERH